VTSPNGGQQTIKKLETTLESVIQAISLTVEMRDQYTAGHQRRVNQLACAIAREMHLPIETVQIMRVAGLLHDFGKIFVPTEILIKPGKLNELEFSLVRSHPQSGYNVLKSIEFPWPIADIILQHHERMDGSGYPSHLRGEEISVEARILATADVVEAMAFHRSYRPALGLDTALKEIDRNKSTLYDPKVAEACLDTFLDHEFKWENV
jgi:putative two-component system response regulator